IAEYSSDHTLALFLHLIQKTCAQIVSKCSEFCIERNVRCAACAFVFDAFHLRGFVSRLLVGGGDGAISFERKRGWTRIAHRISLSSEACRPWHSNSLWSASDMHKPQESK
uniref:Mos1 transposase HTH domain-containing protein n=1 Tax=Parascaris univalens TaxID=6257 RepID=A0A915A1F6_PARUN